MTQNKKVKCAASCKNKDQMLKIPCFYIVIEYMHDTMMINWIFLLWKLRQKSIPVCCRDSCEGKCYRIKYLWFMLISIIRTQCVSDTVFVLLPATLLDVNKILDQENAEKWRYHIDIMLRRFNMKSLLWCYIPAISKLALLLQWGKLIATMISSCKKPNKA